MVKLIILSTLLNIGDIIAIPPDKPDIETRRRNKKGKGRRKGGFGLR